MVRACAALATFLLLASCGSLSDAASASQEDRHAITEAIRGGMTARQTAFVPAPPICPGPVPDSVKRQLAAQAPIRLGAYFTSPQLERELEIATRAMGEKGGPACVYGGGVEWVRLDRVSTTGSAAVARGQFRGWSRIAQWQESGPKIAEPHNTLHVTVNLSRINGQWLISRYTWNFAPGSEP